MELIGAPDNPVPPGALISAVGADDGALLRIARWSPGATSTGQGSLGTICVFTGRGEFIEKYFETIAELVERGFDVVAMDWRGQGLSARELPDRFKGHVDDFDMFERDLEALRKQVLQFLCPRPWYALGHSMSGAVLLSQANAGRSPFERIVLVSPMIEIAGRAMHASTRVVVEVADAIGLGASYAPGVSRRSSMLEPFDGNDLTSDERRYARNAAICEAAPQLAVGGPTIGWLNAALRIGRKLADPEFPRRTTVPTLIVAGADDHVVSIPAIARFANRLKAGRLIQLPGARHEILQETDAIRAQFWAAFDAFVPGGREEAAALRRATDHEAAQRIFNPPWWRRLFGRRRHAA